jgi:hypothetical protein
MGDGPVDNMPEIGHRGQARHRLRNGDLQHGADLLAAALDHRHLDALVAVDRTQIHRVVGSAFVETDKILAADIVEDAPDRRALV